MPWAMREESLQALDERLGELKPSLIVEVGSGQSTAGLRFPYNNMFYVLEAGGLEFYEKRRRR